MSIYGHLSKTFYSKEENQYYYGLEKYYKDQQVDDLLDESGCETPGRVLLDSSLISRTNIKKYSIKVIQCGEYYQVWSFQNVREIIDKNLTKMKDKKYDVNIMMINSRLLEIEEGSNISDIDTDILHKKTDDMPKVIAEKNINRSKAQIQRLTKANENIFKTFITLTFEENVKNVSIANNMFTNWRRQVKRIKNDFAYICVPEFQKRGAVHYHLITNLDINQNSDLILPQKNKKYQYDVRFWNQGYSSVFPIENMNVVGYITKYITKDIDMRLFGKRRYFYSQNLKQPTTLYLNLNDIEDFKVLFKIMDTSTVSYHNVYCDMNGDRIDYKEYKINNATRENKLMSCSV